MKLLLFAILLCSCTEFVDSVHFDVAPELRQATETFYRQASARGYNFKKDDISIQLADLTGRAELGLASVSPFNSYVTIQIDEHYVRRAMDYDRADPSSGGQLMIESVLLHEFGHALLGRDHVDGFSLMNPNLDFSQYVDDPIKREELVNELFNKR